MNSLLRLSLTLAAILPFVSLAASSPGSSGPSARLQTIKLSLKKDFPGAEIQFEFSPALENLVKKLREAPQTRIRLSGTTTQGEALIEVDGDIAKIPFSARINALTVSERILPHQSVTAAKLQIVQIDIAKGSERNMRGQLFSPKKLKQNFIAMHTLQPGKYVLNHSVEPKPDVVRGQMVKIDLISGGLKLSTRGKAQAAALHGDRLKVIAYPSKRPFEGKLNEKNVVEVEL